MVKQRLAGAAASVAMDGVAPEWGQDDPLREEQHQRGAPYAYVARLGSLVNIRNAQWCMPRCRIAVCPSMNPSGVQLRRCAILGFAYHSNPAARIKPMYVLHDCSSGLDTSDESLALS